MRVRLFVVSFLLACAFVLPAHANDTWYSLLETTYPAVVGTKLDDCITCHTNIDVSSARNSFGAAFRSAGHNFAAIEGLDSDGDGYTNLAEITALTFPGDATDHPVASTGSVTVTILPAGAVSAGAQWRVGAGAYQNSGVTVSGLAVGDVTINFKAVTGWTTPADQIVSITAGGSATAQGTYVQLALVPNVVGQTQAAASTQILGASLVVGTISNEYSNTVPSGSVISQSPSAGGYVATGTAVLLTVSKGPQPVITGSILINKGAWATNSANVSLSLTWSANAVRMRFSDNGSTWTAWESLRATKLFTLPAGDGYRTVRVQFIDIANNRSVVYSDYIIVDSVAPTGSIKINNGAPTTVSTAVTLSLTSADAGSGVQYMRFSNDGATWSAWEPVATSKAWVLAGPVGYNTVRVQYRDAAGNRSAVYNDYILLQAA